VDADTADLATIDYDSLAALLAAATPTKNPAAVVDVPFAHKVGMAYLFLGFICFYLVDETKKQLQLVAASGTEEYQRAVETYNFNPDDFHLCLENDQENTLVQAVITESPKDTNDWTTLSRKGSLPEQVRLNQASSGIAYSAIYPFSTPKRGVLMYSFYQYPDKINDSQRTFMKKYTALAAAQLG
jgi:hypothetical protein